MLRRLGSIAGQSTDVPPSAPTITSITPGNGFLNVNFTAPSSDGGRTITNYQFSINNGVAWTTRSPASASSPITITGLTNGVNYNIVIRAINIEGVGATSNMVVAKPYTTATAPQSVTVTNGGGGGSAPVVSISFTAPFSNGGDAITNYQYTLNGGTTWIARSPSSTTSPITISGLSNSVVYSVGVRAVNSAGGGASSGFTSIRPLPHFASFSGSSPDVTSYPWVSAQSSTYRTVNWSADVNNDFSAGIWYVRLMDGATEVGITSNFTTTAASSGSFNIPYSSSTHWNKTLSLQFVLSDSAGQSATASVGVFVPGASSEDNSFWSTRVEAYLPGNDRWVVAAIRTGAGQNKQSGTYSSSDSAAHPVRAWDNNLSTAWRVDGVNSGNTTEVFGTFVIQESLFGTLVNADSQSAGVIRNTSSLIIDGFRFRTGFRNTTRVIFYDDVSNTFKGSNGTTVPSGYLLEGQPVTVNWDGGSVVQDGTWNQKDIPSNQAPEMSRRNGSSVSTTGGQFEFNISIVQLRNAEGVTQVTDAQVRWYAVYEARYFVPSLRYR